MRLKFTLPMWGMAVAAATGLVGCFGCARDAERSSLPFVMASVTDAPRWRIDLNRVRDGIFRSYAPRCLDSVRPGQVVEWRNFLPDAPANVTSLAGPAPIYSPNLVRPYNYVGPDDPNNDLCDADLAGLCTQRPAWSWWRARLDQPGVYDWIDTNQGAPGRKVVDPYYGTTTFVGLAPDAPIGTICVLGADGTGCEGVCCTTDADCRGGTRCRRPETDAVGRCLTPSS